MGVIHQNNMEHTQKKIGIFTIPLERSGLTPVSQLVEILRSLSGKVVLISGNAAMDYFINHKAIILNGFHTLKVSNHKVLRILVYMSTQIRISFKIIKYLRKVDLWFSIFGSNLILPTICIKLSGKKVIQIIAGSNSKSSLTKANKIINKVINSFTNILSDYIIVYSPHMIKDFRLGKYKEKLIIAPQHFVDLKKFDRIQSIAERDKIIGFIGRLSKEKGILNFLEAIKILAPYKEFKYLIIGEGDCRNDVLQFIKKNKNDIEIEFFEWINHDCLNMYINRLKLLVIPSYTEGLPNVMLEAMASGTPILTSRIGAIPDIITDEINGFLLNNNKPKSISDKILQIMKRDLELISNNSIKYIKNHFKFSKTQKRYKNILDFFSKKN